MALPHEHDHGHDADHGHHHSHEHNHKHHHLHSHWRDIRQWIESLAIDPEVKRHSIGIFQLLAEAEALVHSKSIDDVCFHEVGAWDSIIDIMAAGWLIARMGQCSWSMSSLPWGGGLAKTDHGLIPAPAPATARLLRGFPFFDDGIKGERITPTGAAILVWLQPASTLVPGKMVTTGHGFGTKKLPGMSNVLRACLLERSQEEPAPPGIVIMECDIDDQSPESLAVGIDVLRKQPAVIDLVQIPVYGKKGRMAIQLRLLVKIHQQQTVAECLFAHTSTLGIRWYEVNRFELPRGEIQSGEHGIRVKYAERPGVGKTFKAEMDDIASHGHHHSHRESLRRAAEQDAAGAAHHEH